MDQLPIHIVEKIINAFSTDVSDPDDVLNAMLVNRVFASTIRGSPMYKDFQRDRMVEMVSAAFVLEYIVSRTRPYGDLIEFSDYSEVIDLWDMMLTMKCEYAPGHASIEKHGTFRRWVHVPTLCEMVGVTV